jgi:integrase
VTPSESQATTLESHPIHMIQVLSGQTLRHSEIGVDDETGLTVWRLPASRSKNRREITRPLSKAALDIVNAMPIISDSDYVFTLDGVRPMSMNHQRMKDLLAEIAGVDDMRIHDLRRVHRSLLSRCRVPFEIAEMLLGHSRPTLVRTYDQHHPLIEMQEAVERVADEIMRIVSGKPKVVQAPRLVTSRS